MSTLAEIEAAADSLPLEQKQELLLFLASRLRAQGGLLEPGEFLSGQTNKSVAADQAGLKQLLDAQYVQGYLKTPEDISLVGDLLPNLAVDSGAWE